MKVNLTRIGGTAAAAVAALALATACSSSSGTSAASAPSAATSSVAAATASSPAAAAAGVMVTSAPGLGSIVVDAAGRAIYRYDKDSNNPPTATCTGGCATAWPPVPATTTVTGIAGSLIGSVTGSDGAKQLTIAGWPMYYFAQDTAAGQFNGQGTAGVWWVVSPTGTEVKTTAGAASAGASPSKSSGSVGGY